MKEFELNNYHDQFELSEEIELAIRHKDGIEYTFLLNYSERPQEIVVKKEYKNILTGNMVTNKHTLNPFDVLILES
ncbi:Beta-galactosidase C-terminal domain [Bacillus sp. 7884-1]|uniref:Beta-galactosidase C-terminal domain n=1 Tax=Bacillus sp. 7884-1 TaxID=2021693 RepID=UPI0026D66655|nr:Beta-galactosidase C-terminal domain [Bacillus sp. 7884-1]